MAKQQWQVLCYFLTHLAMAVADRSSHRQPGPTKSNKASQVKPWEARSSKVQQGQPGPAMGSNVQQSPATNMKHLQHCTTRSNQVWQPDKPWTAGQTQTHLALSRPGYGSIQPWAARPSNGHQIQPWKGPVMSSQIQPWAARPTWPGSAMTSQQWSGSKVLQYPASSNYGQ